MTELKHCPFCGGEARIMKITDSGGKTGYAVGCGRPFCPTDGAVTRWFVDDGLAVEAWNTRHVETCTIGDYKDPDYGYTHDAMWNDEWFMPSGRCSGCGEYIPVWNYCPNCGRKVEG